ncbi:MAG: ferrous iron transporter B, partial [Oscillospiraceae bacterium]|nr:ferrous iron transporter B [Oscillospiraceae bacterium]
GFGTWQATVATVTGLIAKEEVVSTFGVLYPGNLTMNIQGAYTVITAYSFMIFNLLCAPCFAAMGAIKREMNNAKWTFAAIGYMCLWAYVVALIVYQIGGVILGEVSFGIGTIVAAVLVIGVIYMLVRKGYQGEERSRRLTSVAAAAK